MIPGFRLVCVRKKLSFEKFSEYSYRKTMKIFVHEVDCQSRECLSKAVEWCVEDMRGSGHGGKTSTIVTDCTLLDHSIVAKDEHEYSPSDKVMLDSIRVAIINPSIDSSDFLDLLCLDCGVGHIILCFDWESLSGDCKAMKKVAMLLALLSGLEMSVSVITSVGVKTVQDLIRWFNEV